MFLPTTIKEVEARGWYELDVIIFSGDAYIDHPAFGPAVIGRILEAEGYKVAIVPQPNWRDDLRDFKKLGKPRLFFAVTAGAMDSMVNHYTANLRLRSNDAYTPGGKAGFRPDRTVDTYTKILKELYPHTPVGLWHDSHTIALSLEDTSDDRRTKCGVVDIGITREDDHIELVPATSLYLLSCCRQKHSTYV